MANPFFNPAKLAQTAASGAFGQAKQMVLTAIQNKNPAVLQRLMQAYQNPLETLLQVHANNPQAQQEVKTALKDKPVEEQRKILIDQLEGNGINVRNIAAQFGIKL